MDASFLTEAWEHRVEVYVGSRNGQSALAALWRAGRGFLEENRLRLELQPALIFAAGAARLRIEGAASWIVHPDWTLRAMVSRDGGTKDVRLVFQVYYYKRIIF
jgi:hypothetical protein